jgi:hypothetical protein
VNSPSELVTVPILVFGTDTVAKLISSPVEASFNSPLMTIYFSWAEIIREINDNTTMNDGLNRNLLIVLMINSRNGCCMGEETQKLF